MQFSELYKEPRKRYFSYTDTSFVSGGSPATHDVFSVLKRNAIDGYVICDGAGDLSFAISEDGTNYGQEIVLKSSEKKELKNISVNKIRVTHIADSSYRVFCL